MLWSLLYERNQQELSSGLCKQIAWNAVLPIKMTAGKNNITGLHHVTALADHAGKNLYFYTEILGLRFLKKTINYDDPRVYHLYYGNETGSAGTIMTFFPYAGMRKGRHGAGQMTETAFSVADSSIKFWIERLRQFGVNHTKPIKRFDEEFIYFEDVHGLGLELVFNNKDHRRAFNHGSIPVEHAIKGFYSLTLTETESEGTEQLLTDSLGYRFIGRHENRIRYATGNKQSELIDILVSPQAMKGLSGSGTIHHLAFATPDDESHVAIRERLLSKNIEVTPVVDRQYFHSIYFHEPGGVLFEVATIIPGFTVDEDLADLGTSLRLPAWMEPSRSQIERMLEPI